MSLLRRAIGYAQGACIWVTGRSSAGWAARRTRPPSPRAARYRLSGAVRTCSSRIVMNDEPSRGDARRAGGPALPALADPLGNCRHRCHHRHPFGDSRHRRHRCHPFGHCRHRRHRRHRRHHCHPFGDSRHRRHRRHRFWGLPSPPSPLSPRGAQPRLCSAAAADSSRSTAGCTGPAGGASWAGSPSIARSVSSTARASAAGR